LLEYTSIGSDILPLILGLLFLRKINNPALRVIFIYIIYVLINDIVILILWSNDLSIAIPLSLFTVLEYSLFALYFYHLADSAKFRRFILFLSIIFYAFALISFIFFGKSKGFDALPATLEAFLIIIFCIYYFYDQLNKPQISFIYSTFHFWITIGIFIYVAGTFFLFVQYTILSDNERNNFWIITLISNILKNILFSISFIIPSKPSDSNKKMEKPYDKVFEVS